MQKFKSNQSPTLFDEEEKLSRITKLGDPLVRLNESIDWRMFASILSDALKKEAKGPGGRPGYEYVLMFKILILQEYYGLSDEQMEFQITDRFSFMRFLGLRSCDKVPDHNTIWNFREQLKANGTVGVLFDCFGKALEQAGLIVNKGKIVDASVVEAPRQRNSREQNQQIKGGGTPSEWSRKQSAHKDVDARWTKKGSATFYGYKNHIKIDSGSKLIEGYCVSSASVHDGVGGAGLVDAKDKGQDMHGDSAFTIHAFKQALEQAGMNDKIHEKGHKHQCLSQAQLRRNHQKSKIRARIEHVFGFMHQKRGNIFIYTIGLLRAQVKIGLMNLAYNMSRYALLTRR